MRVSALLALLVALSPFAIGTSVAQTGHGASRSARAPSFSHPVERQKANENLLMVLGGALGGPWIQMAQDIALTVSDGDNLRVLPLAGEGAKQNLHDVLLLRGVDLGITRLEVMNGVRASGEFGPNLDRRIAYIAPLSVDMLQLLARPEISSLKDLKGKKVSIFPKGSIAPTILKMDGVEIEEVNLPLGESIDQMRAGKIFASVCFCSVPVPAFRGVSSELGFKLIEVPYIPALEESYLPGSLSAANYPNLITGGATVQTVGASLLLISYNWPPGSERYRKIEKFVDAFFSKFEKLRQPSRHVSWREVNFSASVRGWPRFPAAQQWLDRQAAQAKAAAPRIDPALARAQAARAAGGDTAEQERLFQEFMQWSRTKARP